MDHEDEVQETENGHWAYLDGTPASQPDDDDLQVSQPGILSQGWNMLTNMVPVGWMFNRRRTQQQQQQRTLQQQSSRRLNDRRNHAIPQPNHSQRSGMSSATDGRPQKRQRAGNFVAGFGEGKDDLPPNVEFTADERPARPTSSFSSSAAAYMTEDDDSDDDMTGPSTSRGRKVQDAGRPVVTVPTRTPFAERRDITSASLKTPPPSSSPSQQRQNSLLPLINTAKRQAMRHPLEQQSKITSFSPPATPQPSRKRNFDSADLEDDAKPVAATTVPTLFNTFPKSSERLTPTLTRFSAFNKSVDSPSVSKLAAPYYASKRYEGLLQQNVAAREAARTKFPPLKPLPPLPLKPYIHSHAQLPSQSPRRDGIKLDYSYVVPSSSVKSVSLSGQQEFVFESSPIVPYGGVKKALEKLMPGGRETPESSRQSSRSPSVRLCSGCGISIRSERGDRCDVCERLKSGGRDNGETVDATTTPQKKARPAAPMQEVFTVNDDTWDCTLCGEGDNAKSSASCKGCGQAKKAAHSNQSSKSSAMPTRSGTTAKPDQQPSAISTRSPDDDTTSSSSAPRGDEPSAKRAHVSSTNGKSSAFSGFPMPSTSTAGATGKVAESVATTVASPPPPAGFVDIWSKAAATKNWSCPGCMCSNADTLEQCPACETPKPGTTVAKAKEPAAAAESSVPLFKFGGPQVPASTFTAQLPAPAASSSTSSSGGFSFGATAAPASTAASAAPLTFSFGQAAAARSDSPAPVVFTGFGSTQTNGPTAIASAVKPAVATPSASTAFFSNMSNGTSLFAVPASTATPAPPPTTAATFPSSFAAQPAASTAAAPSVFGGFASNSISSTPSAAATPAPVTTSAFGVLGIPTFNSSTDSAGAAKPPGTIGFTFGQSGGSATAPLPAFPSFTPMNGTSTPGGLFGQQNGLTTQTNGLPNAAVPAASIFGGGFNAFPAATPLQNGQGQANPLFPVSGLPQPGTFGGGLGPGGMVGTIGDRGRRIVKGKRQLPRS